MGLSFVVMCVLGDCSAKSTDASDAVVWAYQGDTAYFTRDGLIGLVDKSGKILLEAQYDVVEPFDDGVAIVRQNGKYGYIRDTGEVLSAPQWDGAFPFHDGLARVFIGDGNSKPIPSGGGDAEFAALPEAERERYCLHRKYGFIDASGDVVIEPKWDYASDYIRGKINVYSGALDNMGLPAQDGEAFCDGSGNVVAPYGLDYVGVYERGVRRVMKDGKYGLADLDYNVLVEPDWEEVGDPQGDVVFTRAGGDIALVSLAGEVLYPAALDVPDAGRTGDYLFSEGLAAVSQGGRYGYIDDKGNIAVDFRYEEASPFAGGFARVKQSGKWGYINRSAQPITDFIYDSASAFSDGLANVRRNGKWGYIDESGMETIPLRFPYASNFSYGHAKMMMDYGEWGYIDKSGEYLDFPAFESALDFTRSGLAVVCLDRTWGLINAAGEYALDPQFRGIRYNGGSHAIVCIGDPHSFDEKYALADVVTGEILEGRYDTLRYAPGAGDLFWCEMGEDGYYVNARGEYYQKLDSLEGEIFSYEETLDIKTDDQGLCGAYDAQGNAVIPAEWDSLFYKHTRHLHTTDGDAVLTKYAQKTLYAEKLSASQKTVSWFTERGETICAYENNMA